MVTGPLFKQILFRTQNTILLRPVRYQSTEHYVTIKTVVTLFTIEKKKNANTQICNTK